MTIRYDTLMPLNYAESFPCGKYRERQVRGVPGFTLIELVIAIGILGLVLTVAYGGLSQIMRSKKMLDDGRDSSLVANAVLLRLTRELQMAYRDDQTFLLPPRDKIDDQSGPQPVLLGEEDKLGNGEPGDSITFLALEGGQYLPDGGTHSGVVQITYRVEEDPDQSAASSNTYYLIRDETPHKSDPKEAYRYSMIFPITSKLVSLAFDYYDPEKDQWTTKWGDEQKNKLPLMIRFTLAIQSPLGRINSYSTVVPVRAALSQSPT